MAQTFTVAAITYENGVMTVTIEDAIPPDPEPPDPGPDPGPEPEPGDEIQANLPVYGGGFVTGFTQDKLGTTRTGHCDTYGGYVWRPGDSEQQQILTRSKLGHLTSDGRYDVEFDGSGFYALAVAPSDGTIGYGVVFGKVFGTQGNWEPGSFYVCPMPAQVALAKGGRRWQPRADGRGIALANTGAQRLWNDKLAISHFDPLQALVGFQGGSGAYATRDGFRTEPQRIVGVAAPLPHGGTVSPLLVAADPTNPERWAILSQGAGVYVSEDGIDGDYQLTDCPNMPIAGGHMMIDAGGHIFVVGLESSLDNVRRFEGGEWINEDTGVAKAWHCIAVNPSDLSQKILMSLESFTTMTPAGYGGEWQKDTQFPWWPYTSTYRAEVVKWLEGDAIQLYASKLAFDNADYTRVILSHGTGMAGSDMTALVSWFGPWSWQDCSQGITQMVTQQGLWWPSQRRLVTAWDKGWYQLDDQVSSPTTHYPQGVGFTAGWDCDRLGSFGVVLANWQGQDSRKTHDEGDSWEGLAPHPDGYSIGGCIAAFDDQQLLWTPANNGRAVYSLEGGASWIVLDLDGLLPPAGQESGWSFAYYFKKHIAAASRMTPGLGLLWNYGPAAISELQGLWRTRAGPDGKWEHCFRGAPQDNGAGTWWGQWSYHCRLEEVPGQAGYWLFCAGADQPVPLCATRDDGDNFGPVVTQIDGQASEITNCAAFGFGKNPNGGSLPAIRYWAIAGDVTGLFETLDDFANSRLVTSCIDDTLDSITSVLGSPVVAGEWIYGTSGSGWKCSRRSARR